ncbi:MAG: PKD repeat protein [Bacteroidia bacterium]
MKLKKIILAFILCASVSAEAQSNALWTGLRTSYIFNNYSQPEFENDAVAVSLSPNGSICSNGGIPVFYSGAYNLYGADYSVLPNSDSIIRNPNWFPSDYIFRLNQFQYIYLNVYDTFSSSRGVLRKDVPGLYYSILDTRLNNGMGDVDLTQKNILLKQIYKESSYSSSVIVRRDTSSLLLFSQLNDTLWAFTINESGIQLVDQMPVDFTNLTPFPIVPTDEERYLTEILATSSAQEILLLKRIDIKKQFIVGTRIFKKDGYRSYVLDKVGFNSISNTFTGINSQLKLDEWVLDTSQTTERKYFETTLNNAISENDSFIYLAARTDTINSLADKTGEISTDVWQVNIAANPMISTKVLNMDNDFYNICIKEAPDGKMLIHQGYRETSTNKNVSVFHEISNPNVASNQLAIVKNKYKNYTGSKSFYYFPNHVKDHIRLRHSIEYACQATVEFSNFSNPYKEFDKFTWYVTKENGVFDTLISNAPIVIFNESGDYFYKVYAQSNKGPGYAEIWYDTLKIRIPGKPLAAFTAADTTICAYVPLEFTNESTTDTINIANGEKWVWTFGDGETKTVSLPFGEGQGGANPLPGAQHVYTRPGTYTVSLFYSNGFCDSTLTKNQYIKVVDAPAPGFSIDNNRGCSPFTVNVTDTVTENTVKKKIIYGDGAIDSFFANSLPPWGRAGVGAVPHEYTQPGTY